MRGGSARVQPDYLPERANRRVGLLPRGQEHAVLELRLHAVGRLADGRLEHRQRLDGLALGTEHPGLRHQRLDVAGILGEHLVDEAVRLGRLLLVERDRGEPVARRREAVGRRRGGGQHLPRFVHAPEAHVELAERNPCVGRVVVGGERLEVRFGVGRPVPRQVERRQRTVGQPVVGLELERLLENRLRFLTAIGAPEEVGEPQLRGHRRRLDLDGPPERLLGFLGVALGHLQRAEVGVAAALLGRQRDGGLDLLDGAIEVLHACGGVAQQDLRVHALRIDSQGLFRPRARVLELAREQQAAARLHLRLDVVGHEVGRPDVFGHGPDRVAQVRVGFGQLEPGFAVPLVDAHRVAVLDDGVGVLALRDQRVTVGDVLPLGFVVVARTCRGRHGHRDETRVQRLTESCHRSLPRLAPEHCPARILRSHLDGRLPSSLTSSIPRPTRPTARCHSASC